MPIKRFEDNPIIRPGMDPRIGSNINGPSLIKVPDWVEHPLGKYYLYFAHHQGTFIRMAYADCLEGPWTVYSPGVLDMADSFFEMHIASPDVHVLHEQRQIRMYFHGFTRQPPVGQWTRLALSGDGLAFKGLPEILGESYWRAFWWKGYWYTLEMPGTFRRSVDGVTGFEQGPRLFTLDMRHAAVTLDGDELTVFYSNAHDCPERILKTTMTLHPDWHQWQIAPPVTFLEPERDYEGADCALAPSLRGAAHERVRQLRDPCIFEEDGRTYLLYSVAGESGIAIGEILSDGT